MPTPWTPAVADAVLARGDAIVAIGQLDAKSVRHLNRRAAAGEIVKYRGFWNTLSPAYGLGPLKTIWAPVAQVAA